MAASVIDSLKQFGPFSPAHLELFSSLLEAHQFKKGEFILQKGQVCQSFYFLEKGYCKKYHDTFANKQKVTAFYVAGDWVIDNYSFTSQKPGESSVLTLEPCEVLILNVYSIHQLIAADQAFLQLGKLLSLDASNDLSVLSMSIEEKYLQLLKNKPHVIQKFPLKDIASYLDVTPETLSRVRKRIM